MREERVELKARHHVLEKERATQELHAAALRAQLKTALQAARQLQAHSDQVPSSPLPHTFLARYCSV